MKVEVNFYGRNIFFINMNKKQLYKVYSLKVNEIRSIHRIIIINNIMSSEYNIL